MDITAMSWIKGALSSKTFSVATDLGCGVLAWSIYNERNHISSCYYDRECLCRQRLNIGDINVNLNSNNRNVIKMIQNRQTLNVGRVLSMISLISCAKSLFCKQSKFEELMWKSGSMISNFIVLNLVKKMKNEIALMHSELN